jgi:geranylgeranyl reductase family protein
MNENGILYDAVVVGAGPAGSMTAYRLAKAGARVLITDAKTFPREKACGGGVQRKSCLSIPFAWHEVVRGTLQAITFSLNFGNRFTKTYPEPLVYSVLRSEFDEYLLLAAEGAGASVWQGVKAVEIVPQKTHVVVRTDKGNVRCRFVVGADGANSTVGRYLNRRDQFFWQAGLYCEVPSDYIEPNASRRDSMRIDWGTLPSGYAWIFPKCGYCNIGVGGPSAFGRLLRPYLAQFLKAERILKPAASEHVRFSGHQLPTFTTRTRLTGPRIMLVGDAAGLVEPFTGDGISYACHSARLASEVIIENLEKGEPVLDVYEQRVRSEIGSEIYWSRKLMSLAVTFPQAMYSVFRYKDSVWQTFCRILRGDSSFNELRKQVLGPLGLLWSPLSEFVDLCERRALAGDPNRKPWIRSIDGRLASILAEP